MSMLSSGWLRGRCIRFVQALPYDVSSSWKPRDYTFAIAPFELSDIVTALRPTAFFGVVPLAIAMAIVAVAVDGEGVDAPR